MSLAINARNIPAVFEGWSVFAHSNIEAKTQSSVEESAIYIPKPIGNLEDLSTFDYVELRNYIYGINGRY